MRQTTDTLTRPVSGPDEARVSRRALLKVGADVRIARKPEELDGARAKFVGAVLKCQEGSYSGEQFDTIDWACQKIICSSSDAFDSVLLVGECRNQNDGN